MDFPETKSKVRPKKKKKIHPAQSLLVSIFSTVTLAVV